MAYYLSNDGVNDKVVVPVPSAFKYVSMRIRLINDTSGYLADFRPNNNKYMLSTSFFGLTSVKVNNVTVTQSLASFPQNEVCDVFVDVGTGVAGDVTLGTRNTAPGGADWVKFDLFDLVFYDSSMAVVNQFDFTTGSGTTLFGTTGNGTITGSTWVSDATGTTHNGAASITGVSTITASATVIPAAITGSASLQGVATVSATANVVNAPMVGSASLQGVGTATATASVIRSGSANIIGVSTLTASAAGLAVLGGASLTGVGWVMCSAIEGQFIVSVVNLNGVQSFVIALQGSKEQTVQVLGLKDNIVLLEGEI